ncbi:MAG: FecR domain-containing protein [Anaerolineales bacterium]|nr:FecR domain-containing protein [Anaerolineales bacterium]
MILKRIFPILIFLLLATSACQPQAVTEAPALDDSLSAALSELQGTVQAKPTDLDEFQAANKDLSIRVGGQVQTGGDGRARLDLSTGTIIRVAPSTLFTLIANEPVDNNLFTKLNIEIGKVFVILNGGSLDVETPSGLASVRGSYLSVEVDENTQNVSVTCLEGDCQITAPDGSIIKFSDGEKCTLFNFDPETGELTAPLLGLMTPEDFLDWYNNNPEAQQLVNQAYAALTAAAQTEEPAPEDPGTSSGSSGSGGGSTACVELQEPGHNASLLNNGTTDFKWTGIPEAASYKITFTFPDGSRLSLITTETSETRYMEAFAASGSYSWTVTALDENGAEICTAAPITFSKPAPDPKKDKPDPEPQETGTEYNEPY